MLRLSIAARTSWKTVHKIYVQTQYVTIHELLTTRLLCDMYAVYLNGFLFLLCVLFYMFYVFLCAYHYY